MIDMKYDPEKQFSGFPHEALREMCGLIPLWLDEENEGSVFEQLERGYGFPTYDMGGEILEGIYLSSFDEDPPLYPIASAEFERTKEKLFVYEYGIVAVVQESGDYKVVRMD